MHQYLIEGKCLWTIKIPQDCTLGWRSILKIRQEARQLVNFEVGYGSKIFLWYDIWHPNGVLFHNYGNSIIYDAGSQFEAKVSSFLRRSSGFEGLQG